jgi:predicted dinucleotide-binding enzyme
MFLAGDDARATVAIPKLVGDLGFAPLVLGTLHDVGSLLDKGGAHVQKSLVKQA